MQLCRALPFDSSKRQALASFFSRDFLSILNGDGWRNSATAAALATWTEALAHDASAPTP
jgi:hypothetical protein